MFTSWLKIFLLLYYYYYYYYYYYPDSYWPFTFWPSIFPWHLLLLLSIEFFFDMRDSVLRDIMPSLFWARIVCWLCLGWILVFPVGFPENRLCCSNCSLGLAIGFDMTAGGARCRDPCLNCHFFRNSMNSHHVYTINDRYTQSELNRLYR